MKPGRLWFPLDVGFWDDPETLAMGESAAVLFLRLVAYAKRHETDGWVPMAYVRKAGGRRWADKLAPILRQKWAALADEAAPDCAQIGSTLADMPGAIRCHIVAYLAWNDSSDDIEQRRETAREKKRAQRAAKPIVPQGQRAEVPTAVPALSPQQESEQSRVRVDPTPIGVGNAPNPSNPEVTPTPAPGSVGAILRGAPLAPANTPPDDAPCQVPELMEAMVRAVRRLVHDLYMAKLTYCHDLNGQEVQRLTLILRDMATARGEALPVVVERAVTGYLSDPYWQKARWPLYALVRHAARYADPVKPEDVKAVVATPKPDAKLASLRSKLAAAESQRQIEASLNPGGVAKLDEKIEGMRREMKRLEGAT